MSDIVNYKKEVDLELANPEVLKTLVATTFKGVTQALVPQAIVEGRIRGFTFKDFLEKNIYAVPYGQTYSLVTSIDYARKVGARSGVVGKSAPEYREVEGKIKTCKITVQKRFKDGHIGDFTAEVYFDEYTTGKNLWQTKPHTMIAKVAEMHALRMACPEELAQAYAEEEIEKVEKAEPKLVITDEQMTEYNANLRCATTLEELQKTWAALPAEAKNKLYATKEELKKKITTPQTNANAQV